MQSLKHLQAGAPLGLFPSGAVSDLSIKDGCIRDREWQLSAIQLIKKARVPIVPIRFRDKNSMFYYLLGLLNWKIRVTRLPREVFNKRDKRIVELVRKQSEKFGCFFVMTVTTEKHLLRLQTKSITTIQYDKAGRVISKHFADGELFSTYTIKLTM